MFAGMKQARNAISFDIVLSRDCVVYCPCCGDRNGQGYWRVFHLVVREDERQRVEIIYCETCEGKVWRAVRKDVGVVRYTLCKKPAICVVTELLRPDEALF